MEGQGTLELHFNTGPFGAVKLAILEIARLESTSSPAKELSL